MAGPREDLRPKKPKQPKPAAKSNAQKCKEYKERIKQDPVRYEEWKQRKREQNRCRGMKYLSEEEKKLKREKNRQYMQKRRAKQKSQQPRTSDALKSRKKRKKLSRAVCSTWEQALRDAMRREQNKLCQRKRRANMSSEIKERTNEKRRERYLRQKAQLPATKPPHNETVSPIKCEQNLFV